MSCGLVARRTVIFGDAAEEVAPQRHTAPPRAKKFEFEIISPRLHQHMVLLYAFFNPPCL